MYACIIYQHLQATSSVSFWSYIDTSSVLLALLRLKIVSQNDASLLTANIGELNNLNEVFQGAGGFK